MNIKILVGLIIFLFGVTSCDFQKKEVFQLPENANELIAGDSVKTWKLAKRFNDGTRMNMGDCFLSYRVSYDRNKKMSDNNSNFQNCGESLEANWEIITNDDGSFLKLTGEKISELLQIKEDYKYFKINALSENEMIVQFKHRQFSSNATIIIDHLVPEELEVQDRAFHH